MHLATPQKLLRSGPKRNKELKASTWPPNFPDPNLIEHPWTILEQVRATGTPTHNPQDPKDLLPKPGAKHHRTAPEVQSHSTDPAVKSAAVT